MVEEVCHGETQSSTMNAAPRSSGPALTQSKWRRMPGHFACLSDLIHTFWLSWNQTLRRSALATSSLALGSLGSCREFVDKGEPYDPKC